ncbi:hypothetical protein [Ascidiimonas sp. W6]|uniref:hypothetical protein n=1 Tax=Ascidiimonas meishanensis TaxID=3128903 RepID=UPI0030ECABDD
MKKNRVSNLKLTKSTVSKLNSKLLAPSMNERIKGGGWSDYPCIDNLGEPSFHCGSLGCESMGCISEFWTESRCDVLLP